ncbi:hypothetical protein GQ44DRAFT_733288 [Phaeosphaeriaceae sp. PMI808]|nr:hypothetical protein GQ44DRAFT_733288 [Phaeosphaeriaceae sp. PMI808]
MTVRPQLYSTAPNKPKKPCNRLEALQLTQPYNDPRRVATQRGLAAVYKEDKQLQKAIPILEHVAEVQARSPKDDDPMRVASQYALATIYHDNGQLQKALPILEHVVSMDAKSLEEGDPGRLKAINRLKKVYAELEISKTVPDKPPTQTIESAATGNSAVLPESP